MTGRSLAPLTNSSSLTRAAAEAVARVSARPPLHAPTTMNRRTAPLREASWHALNPTVQTKLLNGAGRVLEWFAQPDPTDGRPRAWLLGTETLATAEPCRAPDGRRVYNVQFLRLDPHTFRTKHIDHHPGRTSRLLARRRLLPGEAAPIRGLRADTAGTLGNLPSEVQELIQAPFLNGLGLIRNAAYYEGTDDRLSPVVLILADCNHITAAFGTRTIPAGHTEATAHWSLTCVRAETRGRS